MAPTLGAEETLRAGVAWGGIAGQPVDAEHTTLELETTYLSRTGRDPTNEDVVEYLEHHGLQAFLTEVIMYIAQHVPPDPFDFLLDHMEAMVMKHRAGHCPKRPSDAKAGAWLSTSEPPPPVPPEPTPGQRGKVVRQLAAVLQHEGTVEASAGKLFEQFAAGGEHGRRLTRDGFDKLVGLLGGTWGLQPEDSQLMLQVLQRWHFRNTAAQGARGMPLWPLTGEDFASVYPSMLRSVRDRYVPIGGKLHRSLFIRKLPGQLTDKYSLGPTLGRGAFGEVLLVTLKESRTARRVCKRVAREQQQVPSEELQGEVDILRGLDHPHIVRLFEYFETDRWLDMILEPVFGGTLTRLVRGLYCDESGASLGVRPQSLTEAWVATAISQLLSALAYAHDVAGVIHKDLKPDNVLLVGRPGVAAREQLAEPLHAMLADFGIAEVFSERAALSPDEQSVPPCLPGDDGLSGSTRSGSSGSRGPRSSRVGGTPAYMSPEMFAGSFTEKCDIWSLGVIVFQLLSGELPYQADNVLMQAHLVCNPRRHPPWDLLTRYNWSLGARWFCQELLSKDEKLRPGATVARRDAWLTKAAQSHTLVAPGEAELSALHGQHLQSHLVKMATAAVTSQLNLSQLHQLNLRFMHYDASGDGRLNQAEIRQVLRDAGITAGGEVELMIESLDGDRSGFIEYSEFVAGCIDLAAEGMREQLRAAFVVFDLDGSGSLTLRELRQVLTEGPNTAAPSARRPPAGPPGAPPPGGLRPSSVLPDGKTAEEVMRELDRDRTGVVTFEEFEAYLLAEHARVGQAIHAKQMGGG